MICFNFLDRKEWLSKTGSKKSRIDKCDFKNERTLDSFEYNSFEVIEDA